MNDLRGWDDVLSQPRIFNRESRILTREVDGETMMLELQPGQSVQAKILRSDGTDEKLYESDVLTVVPPTGKDFIQALLINQDARR